MAGRPHLPSACSATRSPSPPASPGGERAPTPRPKPTHGDAFAKGWGVPWKAGASHSFFFFCVPEEHSSPAPCTSPAKAPGCPLLRQPILSPPPPPPRAMRHVESPSWSHSPGKNPRRVGNGPLCNGAGGESRCSQNPVWGRAGALPFPSRALRETRAAKTCFSQAEKVRFFCPPATEPTRLRPAPKPTKSSQCCSAENACGRWGKRASRLAIDIPISTALAISSYRYMYH